MEVVIIGMPERGSVLIEKFEYSSPVELDAIGGNYFAIPASIIMDTDMTEKRATVFSFFSSYRGLNSSLFFSINNIVKWTGKQPNRHANGINSKIIQVIECIVPGSSRGRKRAYWRVLYHSTPPRWDDC